MSSEELNEEWNEEHPYICFICGMQFETIVGLHEHMAHPGDEEQ